ncbi:hypothetical protein [Clostridium estertheticum]|uniref:hypothetical protein n=1 Tax=Clostridium estertheticum TaxID=238834 RepID=UPI001C0E5302|nr:hypothetical protein [Clostridium estertheticum]MBU3173271.1 hypothetical protein [Clostridium estertheticum]
MNELMLYMNKMVSYVEGNDYDGFFKEMINEPEKYSCFARCYSEMNMNDKESIGVKMMGGKLKLMGLEYGDNFNNEGKVVNYKEIQFCRVSIGDKRIIIYIRNFKTLEDDITYIKSRLNEINEILTSKFKKINLDGVTNSIGYIKKKCENIDFPVNEWEELIKSVSYEFKGLGFDIVMEQS